MLDTIDVFVDILMQKNINLVKDRIPFSQIQWFLGFGFSHMNDPFTNAILCGVWKYRYENWRITPLNDFES